MQFISLMQYHIMCANKYTFRLDKLEETKSTTRFVASEIGKKNPVMWWRSIHGCKQANTVRSPIDRSKSRKEGSLLFKGSKIPQIHPIHHLQHFFVSRQFRSRTEHLFSRENKKKENNNGVAWVSRWWGKKSSRRDKAGESVPSGAFIPFYP